MQVKIPKLCELEVENGFYGYSNKIRKDGKSFVITLKKEIVAGCCIPSDLLIHSQLAKIRNRLALVTFLDGCDFYGRKIKKEGSAGKLSTKNPSEVKLNDSDKR